MLYNSDTSSFKQQPDCMCLQANKINSVLSYSCMLSHLYMLHNVNAVDGMKIKRHIAYLEVYRSHVITMLQVCIVQSKYVESCKALQ